MRLCRKPAAWPRAVGRLTWDDMEKGSFNKPHQERKLALRCHSGERFIRVQESDRNVRYVVAFKLLMLVFLRSSVSICWKR